MNEDALHRIRNTGSERGSLDSGVGGLRIVGERHESETTESRTIDILVVDDEPSVRGFIARVLTQHGYACRTATDASEALSEVMKRTPMLTISDIRMPGKDGTWLLLELKNRWPDMGVIILTGVAEAKTAVQCLKGGADDYLVKPIDLDELLIAVKRTTERIRLLEEK